MFVPCCMCLSVVCRAVCELLYVLHVRVCSRSVCVCRMRVCCRLYVVCVRCMWRAACGCGAGSVYDGRVFEQTESVNRLVMAAAVWATHLHHPISNPSCFRICRASSVLPLHIYSLLFHSPALYAPSGIRVFHVSRGRYAEMEPSVV
uniref:Secreted protein n=1 Tax=Setaria digitata TaxID=48799 RepID=A0A915PZF2_9BILA